MGGCWLTRVGKVTWTQPEVKSEKTKIALKWWSFDRWVHDLDGFRRLCSGCE